MKIINFILLLVHLAVVFMLCLMLLNEFLSAGLTTYTNLLALAFPGLMFAHFMLCLYWIFSWKKRSVVFVLVSILFFNATRRWVNYNKPQQQGSFKVLSMNTKGGKYAGKDKLRNYLVNHKDYDLIFLQEDQSEHINNAVDFGINKLFTKHKILQQEKIASNEDGVVNGFYADIDVNGKTIRAINVYLEPFQFHKSMVKPTADADVNKQKARMVVGKLLPVFRTHQKQVEEIQKFIKESPYPVILAGDFNSVPNSYEYFAISKYLKDAFLEVGSGNGTSFHDYKFPIRIDYIFASPSIKPATYQVDRSQKLSDHYAVLASFNLK